RTASGVSLWMGAVARDRHGRYGGRRRHVRELYRGAPGTVSRGDPAARYGRDRAALGRQLRRRQAGGSDPERLHDSETRRAGCPGRRGPVRVPSQPPPTSTVLGGGGDVVVALGAALVPVLFAYGGWQQTNFIAEEIIEPERSLPRALMLGVAGVVTVYLLANVAYLRVLGVFGPAARPAARICRIWGLDFLRADGGDAIHL